MTNEQVADIGTASPSGLSTALGMLTTTQPPRSQRALCDLMTNHASDFTQRVQMVESVTGPLPSDPGKVIDPAQDPDLDNLAHMLEDPRREFLSRMLRRKFDVDYLDDDGAPWSCDTGTIPGLKLTAGASLLWQHARTLKASVQLEVNAVSRLGNPTAAQALRMALQQFTADLDMALAMGVGAWLPGRCGTNTLSWTCLVVDVTARVTSALVFHAKGIASVARPSDSCFQPPSPPPPAGIVTPAYSAYPAGHPAVTGALAEVLAFVRPTSNAALATMAGDIGDNRMWARLHTELDVRQGAAFGRAVGRELVAMGTGSSRSVWSTVLQAAAAEWA
ncbi:hypothetical protein [Ideonella sp. BN130291]|uniref:hypothetical protein n=1 Tax=Ideonella sp. BN130291 TaxID=3112940 RepID=UPI002E27313E|nr:hypothetical protein [Ideonella sp. BN130291]